MDPKSKDEAGMPHAAIIARSMEELRIKTAAHDRLFQIGRAAWRLDQDTGLITFTGPSGIITSAPAQIVGSFNTVEGTWLWAWDNESVNPKLRVHAALTREYGEKHGIGELTSRKISTTEDKCWEFAALTCHLGNYQGAYRGPGGDTMVFITFGEVKLQKAK
jgi:hypothetical protein